MKNYFERTVRIVFVIALIGLAGCDKKNESPIKEQELTSGSGKWKLTALTVTASGQTEDAFADLDECEKDDIYYFADDGTYQLQVGVTKCDPGEPDILESGAWEINGKNLLIYITGEDPEAVTIKLLNATTLKCSYSFDFFGVPATINATYTKQS